MAVFSNSWAQNRNGLTEGVINRISDRTSTPSAPISTPVSSGPTKTSMPSCGWNYPSICSASSMFTGTLMSLMTYSAYDDSVNMRFGLNVTSYAGSDNCMSNSVTQGIIGFKPPLVYGSAIAQLQQDWRNMALMAKASGQIVTIYTDGACNILDMTLN